jgi:hypothetical protein
MTINQKKSLITFDILKFNYYPCIDNSSYNLLKLCLNILIHKLNPVFDYYNLEYVYSDSKRDKLILDFHLTHGKEDK